MSFVVTRPGPRTTVQDLGRPGLATLGISPAGAVDRAAPRLGNRLLGNPEGSAGLECTMGGLALQADSGHWCVVTGAEARVTVDGRPVGCGMPFFVEPDTTVAVGAPTRGLRSYLAVSGGLATPSLLRSRSEDTLGRIVPLPIEAGAVLPVGPSGWLPRLDQPHHSPLPASGPLLLPVAPGPRRDWLEDSSGLPSRPSPSPVSSKLDRIGVRFEGPALTRSVTRTLPSEGLIRGAVQLPPSGDPIVLLADHPTTRGYPVIAVVDDATTDLLAQVTPGQSVRFIDAAS
jgi:biotin-dependent carboxylase-like uncharacterized protein